MGILLERSANYARQMNIDLAVKSLSVIEVVESPGYYLVKTWATLNPVTNCFVLSNVCS